MKKTLMVIMMALLAVSVGFATNLAEAGEVPGNLGSDVTIQATLNLSNADFDGYSIGFSSSDPDLKTEADTTVTANEKTSVALEYKGAGNADNVVDVIYYYYKVRTAQNVTLTMKTDQLKDSGKSLALNFTVTATDVTGEGFSEGVPVPVSGPTTLMNVSVNDGFVSGKGKMTFNVVGLDATKIGNYTTDIVMNIKANA